MQVCQQPLNLEFRDLTYTRNGKHNQARKEILHGACGRFQAGRLTAILGPSGAGKTSLLNILSGFRTIGAKGSVLVNGQERVPQAFRKECSYITQEFAMLDLLTVQETFKTTADLKLGINVPEHKKVSVINDIAQILNIRSCFHTQVKHLSGGEKKRLCIGLELITNPPIMFFDEPTSGLDSSSAVQVIAHLKTLARGGRTIVCVIHQPSSRLFEMFDDVFILTEGRTLYNGSVENMVPALETCGFPCPNYYNRADFALEVACRDRGEKLEPLFSLTAESMTLVSRKEELGKEINGAGFLLEAVSSQEALEPMLGLTLQERMKPPESTRIQVTTPLPNLKPSVGRCCRSSVTYPTPTRHQLWILLKRTFICTCVRDLHMAQIRFIAQIVVGILMGTVFYNLGNEASKVQSNASYLFFSIMFIFFSNAMPTVQTFPSEAAVFIREHLNNWYSMRAYYFSKLAADLPLQIVNPTVYFLVTYFLTDQPFELDRLGKVLLLGIVITIMAQALGHVFGAAFDAQLGTFLIPASAIPMFLFSGFFILFRDLPLCLKWLSYLSYFRYPFEGLMMAIYGNNRPRMHCSELLCVYKNPKKFLDDYDLGDGDYWLDIMGVVIWIVVLRVLFFLILKWKLYRIRGY